MAFVGDQSTRPGSLEPSTPAGATSHVSAHELGLAHARDLGRVEEAMADALAEDNPFVSTVLQYLTGVGGKRLRPILALSSVEACRGHQGPADPAAVLAAAIVELVHVGTLYHDDIIDEADLRRGVPSANARWSNTIAVLAGDYLIARASEVAASMGGDIAKRLSLTIADMCRGQLLESAYSFDTDRSVDAYLDAISGKTAALMASSCWLAPLAVGCPQEAADSLRRFGHAFGMVYQIVDDFLDVMATSEDLGKPAGADVAAGIYNLPLILAFEERPALKELLGREIGSDGHLVIREEILATSAVEGCIAHADSYCELGIRSLHAVPGASEAAVAQLTGLIKSLRERIVTRS